MPRSGGSWDNQLDLGDWDDPSCLLWAAAGTALCAGRRVEGCFVLCRNSSLAPREGDVQSGELEMCILAQWKLSQLKAGKFLTVRERWMSSIHSRWPLQYMAGCSIETDISLLPAHQGVVNAPVGSFLPLQQISDTSPLQGEPTQPFSYLRHLVSPCLLLWPELFPALLCACFSLSWSMCLWGISCWTLYPSQLLGLSPAILYSLLLSCKPGCELGGWMFLRCQCNIAPSLAGWVAGGGLRCLFSLLECLEPWNGLTWVFPFVS